MKIGMVITSLLLGSVSIQAMEEEEYLTTPHFSFCIFLSV